MNPLELATVDDLLEELRRRHSAVVFASLKRTDGDDESEDFRFWHKGGLTVAVGMAKRVTDILSLASCSEMDRADDEDDDSTA